MRPKAVLLGFMSIIYCGSVSAQTVEERLAACVKLEVDKYQPVSSYSNEFKCSVGNKKPGGGTPSKGPYTETVSYNGFVILTATAQETFKISEGGNTPPIISPRHDRATLTLWCAAEDKWYGKSGKYNVRVFGQRQRVATDTEFRRALTLCSRQVEGIWSRR